MSVQVYEVVKEFVFWVEGLPHTVRGRITRHTDAQDTQRFMWEISHNYKPSASAAGVYYPSRVSAGTQEEAERMLFAYALAFTSIGVKANENY